MKNISTDRLKKCIFLTFDEYNDLVLELTDGLQCAEFDCGEVYIFDTFKADETETYFYDGLTKALEEYYDIKISSIHNDNYEPIGIWIVYE